MINKFGQLGWTQPPLRMDTTIDYYQILSQGTIADYSYEANDIAVPKVADNATYRNSATLNIDGVVNKIDIASISDSDLLGAEVIITAVVETDNYRGYSVLSSIGNSGYRILKSAAGGNYYLNSGTDTGIAVPENSHHAIKATYDASGQGIAFEVIGVGSWTGVAGTGYVGPTEPYLHLGSRDGGSSKWRGEFAYYKIERAGVVLAEYSFNGGGGLATLFDESGNGHNGVISSAGMISNWNVQDNVPPRSVITGFTRGLLASTTNQDWFQTSHVVNGDFNLTVMMICGSGDETSVITGGRDYENVYQTRIKRRQGLWHISVGDYTNLNVGTATTGEFYKHHFEVSSNLMNYYLNDTLVLSNIDVSGAGANTLPLRILRSNNPTNNRWGDHFIMSVELVMVGNTYKYEAMEDGTLHDIANNVTLINKDLVTNTDPLHVSHIPSLRSNRNVTVFNTPIQVAGGGVINDSGVLLTQPSANIVSKIAIDGSNIPVNGTLNNKVRWMNSAYDIYHTGEVWAIKAASGEIFYSGAELVSDPHFLNGGTGWGFHGAYWSIANGEAEVYNSGTMNLTQWNIFTWGNNYFYSFEISQITSGSIDVIIAGVNVGTFTTAGKYTGTVTATGSEIQFQPSATFLGKIKYVDVLDIVDTDAPIANGYVTPGTNDTVAPTLAYDSIWIDNTGTLTKLSYTDLFTHDNSKGTVVELTGDLVTKVTTTL